jgi:hypothetical protein
MHFIHMFKELDRERERERERESKNMGKNMVKIWGGVPRSIGASYHRTVEEFLFARWSYPHL